MARGAGGRVQGQGASRFQDGSSSGQGRAIRARASSGRGSRGRGNKVQAGASRVQCQQLPGGQQGPLQGLAVAGQG